MKTLFAAVVLPLIILFSGCAAGLPPQSINENPLLRLAEVDETGVFTASRDGRNIAFARDGLNLHNLESDVSRKLSRLKPAALAWNPSDLFLAAAFPVADYETRLILYSAQGEALHETVLPVAFSQMIWSVRGDLLLTGFALKTFSFGADLLQMLYRVDGNEVVETVLSNTTLKLTTVKRLAPIMTDILPVTFSPSGDELVYVHLHDPPQFSPYLQLLYKNWQVGGRRLLQKLPLQTLQVTWDNSEQSVVVRSSKGLHRLDLWPTPEDSVGQPVVEHYRFVDGRLYDGEQLLANWGEAAHLQILPDGRFLLAAKQALYRGDGLRAGLLDGYSERAWTLRRWRFEGLITADEYLKLLREESP